MRLLAFLLLLFGCQRSSQWHYDNIPAKHTSKYTRISYISKDRTSGIDVELLYTGEHLATYLEVHSHPIHPSKKDPDKVELRLTSENKVIRFLADYHEGNQRVRLGEILQTEFITLLNQGSPVIIEFSGYRETVDPGHFAKVFKRLDKPPYRIPFHLPI